MTTGWSITDDDYRLSADLCNFVHLIASESIPMTMSHSEVNPRKLSLGEF